MVYIIYASLVIVFVLILRMLRKNESFINDGICVKDLIVLIICFTLVFVMISYVWVMDELIKHIDPTNSVVLVKEFLKSMFYITLCFIIPFGVTVSYYFLSERNAKGISQIIDSLKNNNRTPSPKGDNIDD